MTATVLAVARISMWSGFHKAFFAGWVREIAELIFGIIAFMLLTTVVLRRRSAALEAAQPGLHGVVGRMGGGKSYFLADHCMSAVKAGRLVFANFEIQGARPLDRWEDVLAVPNGCLVLIDEAHLWWPSDSWRAPVEVRSWITQLRHHGITCFWASQSVMFVAKWLRVLSFSIWECERYKRGHQYSQFLWQHAERVGSPAKRPTLSRVYRVRSSAVMHSYDHLGDVRSAVEWGGADLGAPSALRDEGSRSAQVLPIRPRPELAGLGDIIDGSGPEDVSAGPA
jgi:hypothetical protein